MHAALDQYRWPILMQATRQILLIVSALTIVCACESEDTLDPVAYEAEILEWRVGRLERLKGPTGYLNLAGLHWLDKETTTFGSAAANDFVLPAAAAPSVGSLTLTEQGVEMTVADGVDVRHEDEPVQALLLADDTTENPVTITHGSLVWTVIKRDGRFALRLRDYDHPAIAAFPPIEYYPIDTALRVNATLREFAERRILNVETVIEGLGWNPQSPGKVEFEVGGEVFELEAYASGDDLFFVFGDQTSGRETYPAGRFLYAAWPADGGTTVLDFNRAYNPPCAFNDFATCPVASPQNRLATRIEAGEKYDPKVHATPDLH